MASSGGTNRGTRAERTSNRVDSVSSTAVKDVAQTIRLHCASSVVVRMMAIAVVVAVALLLFFMGCFNENGGTVEVAAVWDFRMVGLGSARGLRPSVGGKLLDLELSCNGRSTGREVVDTGDCSLDAAGNDVVLRHLDGGEASRLMLPRFASIG